MAKKTSSFIPKFLQRELLFITGSDTGVGKTIVSSALCNEWKKNDQEVCAIKAVAAGGSKNARGDFRCEDSEVLFRGCTEKGADLIQLGIAAHSPIVGLKRAMAPYTASLLENSAIDCIKLSRSIKQLKSKAQKMSIRFLVEGAGGALVPLDKKRTVADLIGLVKMPAVIVARTELGTINHTLMTVEVLEQRGVEIAGVVLNRQRTGPWTVIEKASCQEIELFLHRKKIEVCYSNFVKLGFPTFGVLR